MASSEGTPSNNNSPAEAPSNAPRPNQYVRNEVFGPPPIDQPPPNPPPAATQHTPYSGLPTNHSSHPYGYQYPGYNPGYYGYGYGCPHHGHVAYQGYGLASHAHQTAQHPGPHGILSRAHAYQHSQPHQASHGPYGYPRHVNPPAPLHAANPRSPPPGNSWTSRMHAANLRWNTNRPAHGYVPSSTQGNGISSTTVTQGAGQTQSSLQQGSNPASPAPSASDPSAD